MDINISNQQLNNFIKDLYKTHQSHNLKMPFAPHVISTMVVIEAIKGELAEVDYNKLKSLALLHDLIMLYKNFKFPPTVLELIDKLSIDINELKVLSLKHLRDIYGKDDWSILAPLYVDNLFDFANPICIISSLICWQLHISFCIKNSNSPYLSNLYILYKEFNRRISLNYTKNFKYIDLIKRLLVDFHLQLKLADVTLETNIIN